MWWMCFSNTHKHSEEWVSKKAFKCTALASASSLALFLDSFLERAAVCSHFCRISVVKNPAVLTHTISRPANPPCRHTAWTVGVKLGCESELTASKTYKLRSAGSGANNAAEESSFTSAGSSLSSYCISFIRLFFVFWFMLNKDHNADLLIGFYVFNKFYYALFKQVRTSHPCTFVGGMDLHLMYFPHQIGM